MSNRRRDWIKEVEADAKNMVIEFVEEIVEELFDEGEAPRWIHEYSERMDDYHRESHPGDVCWDLLESAQCLDDLADYEEDDPGLWQGQDPRDAVATMAHYTYQNAVSYKFKDLIESINRDSLVESIASEDFKWFLEEWGEDREDEWLENKKNRLKAAVESYLDVLECSHCKNRGSYESLAWGFGGDRCGVCADKQRDAGERE